MKANVPAEEIGDRRSACKGDERTGLRDKEESEIGDGGGIDIWDRPLEVTNRHISGWIWDVEGDRRNKLGLSWIWDAREDGQSWDKGRDFGDDEGDNGELRRWRRRARESRRGEREVCIVREDNSSWNLWYF